MEKLPELRRLILMWAAPGQEAREPCRYTGSRFARASPGVMPRVVQVTPQLVSLVMVDVRISLPELLTIMKWMGKRLHGFKTSIGDQEESPFERLEALLVAAANHNRELRAFWVEDVKHERGPIPAEEWKLQARRVLVRLEYLREQAPCLSVRAMEMEIQRMALAGP